MLSPWRDFDRIGMPSLLGWDPSPLFEGLRSLGASSPVQLKEEENQLTITADMPGVDPKDLDVTFEGGTLYVMGQRGETRYRFSVYVGNEYDIDGIEADLDKGVLTLRAEKRPEARPRKIALKGVEAKRLESGAAK